MCLTLLLSQINHEHAILRQVLFTVQQPLLLPALWIFLIGPFPIYCKCDAS